MGVSYNRWWKMLIDKNMKRIEMQYLTGISGNIPVSYTHLTLPTICSV